MYLDFDFVSSFRAIIWRGKNKKARHIAVDRRPLLRVKLKWRMLHQWWRPRKPLCRLRWAAMTVCFCQKRSACVVLPDIRGFESLTSDLSFLCLSLPLISLTRSIAWLCTHSTGRQGCLSFIPSGVPFLIFSSPSGQMAVRLAAEEQLSSEDMLVVQVMGQANVFQSFSFPFFFLNVRM